VRIGRYPAAESHVAVYLVDPCASYKHFYYLNL
jgi:hypothetical protein